MTTQVRVLALGDSKTAGDGWLVKLVSNLNALTDKWWFEAPVRIAVGGYETTDMAARCDADIAAMQVAPDEVLINLGAGDCNSNPGKAAWKADMLHIVSAYHTAFPSANIRITKIWRRATSPQYATVIAYMNEAIDELYASYSYLKAGINEALFLENGDDGVTYTSDGVHPTEPAGYQLEANAWRAAMGY